MGKKSLEKINSSLIGNLLNELLFYIPENELTMEFVIKLEDIGAKDVFNKVFIMDKMQGPIKYKKNEINKAMMKTSMLQENMYLLLKKKKKLDVQEFNFVFDNYFEQAEFCFYITNWFHTDLETNTSIKLDLQLRGMFELQYQGYKKHFEKLVKHFYPKKESLPNGNFNVLATIEKYFPELIKKYDIDNKVIASNDILIAENRSSSNNNQTVETKKRDTITKQQPLITVLEAEQFLLKSVFNVDFEKVNQ